MFNFLKNLWSSKVEDVPGVLQVAAAGADFNYLVNDPTTPNLRLPVSYPSMGKLDFSVAGKVKNPRDTKQKQAANVYITIGNFINYFQKRARTPVRRWAATQRLRVVPVAGKMLNAYYNRKGLHFFFELDPKTMQIVYTADSGDIVAHELGHALLDAMRPDFWSVQALEIWSFHETFADVAAMMSIMQHDIVLRHALKETGGDLRKSNVICRLAEEVGNTVYHLTRGQGGRKPGALRDASNVFKYVNPAKLPKQAPDNELAAECHSFGRVFLGAWYESMVSIYNYNMRKGMSPLKALKNAKEVAYRIFLEAIPSTPRTPRYFDAVARSMIAIAKSKGEDYVAIYTKVFEDWNLLRPQIKILSNKTWDEVREGLKETDEVLTHGDTTIVRSTSTKTIKLGDHIPDGMISAMTVAGQDLADVEVEVAADSYYEFKNGHLVEEIVPDEQEVIDDARLCALAIQFENDLGPDDETMWAVEDGKLVRTFVA